MCVYSKQRRRVCVLRIWASLAEFATNWYFEKIKEWGRLSFLSQPLLSLAHSGLVKKKINEYQPIFDERRNTLVINLWQERIQHQTKDGGLSLTRFIEHYTMTSILAIAFGNMCSFEPGDTRLHQAFALTERAASIFGPTEQLAEFFPVIKMILPSRKKEHLDIRSKMVDFYGGLLAEFRRNLEKDINGNLVDECFMKDIMGGGELTDLQMMNFITVFVGAGKGICVCVGRPQQSF